MPKNPWIARVVDDMQHFGTLISGPRTTAQIVAAGVGDDFMFGSIIWEKSLGRPQSPRMADGFDILLNYKTVVLIGDGFGGPAHEVSLDTPLPVTGKWDADDGGSQHRVYFVFGGLAVGRNYTVDVTLASGVRWPRGQLTGPWILDIEPDRRAFRKDTTPAWLEPFEVIASPFIFINP